MPYDPNATFDPLRSVGAGQGLVSPLAEALQKYEQERKKTLFNQGVFDILKDKTDSSGKPFIPPDAIARWDSLNPDKQAGLLSAAGAAAQEDMKRQQLAIQKQEADAAIAAHMAAANLSEAKAHEAWTGTGEDAALVLSPEERAAAERAGVVPLRQSKGSFQYKEDPNSPVNMGTAPPSLVRDPRDPNKIIGLQQPNGAIKYFPKSSTIQEMIDLGYMQRPAGQPPAAPAPTAAPRTLSGQDQAALNWAQANPQDPRSAAILKKLGIQ